jgi:hypothetical protein
MVRSGHNDGMAEDEIERLLREVQQQSGSSQPAKASPGAVPAKSGDRDGGGVSRVAFAGGSAVVLGFGGWLLGVLTPFTTATELGLGAAVGAFVTGLVAGPPRWMSRS